MFTRTMNDVSNLQKVSNKQTREVALVFERFTRYFLFKPFLNGNVLDVLPKFCN